MDRFTIGGVLNTGFSVFFRNFIPFTIIAALVYLPVIIGTAVLLANPLDHETYAIWNFVLALVKMIVNLVVTAALTYGVIMQLNGTKASLGSCIATGFSRLLPVLAVTLLLFFILMLGFVALIVPGVILYLMFFVATCVAVVEKPGVLASLSRSRELTRGRKGELFLIVLIMFGMAFFFGAFLAIGFIPKYGTNGEFETLPLYIWLRLAIDILVSSLTATMTAAAYYFLRREKEGTSTEALAQVFA